MQVETRKIPVDETFSVSSVWAIPRDFDAEAALIIAHGAGNDMQSPFLTYLHHYFAESGLLSVKFNFPYKEQGKRLPDRAAKLIATWRAVVNAVKSDASLRSERLILSGKSLGGRMASMLQAEDACAQALVFLGYPLHPSRQPSKLRSAHLMKIDCPMLFVQGTRDPLCDLGLLQSEVLDHNPHASLLVIEGGDHSFKVPKKLNRDETDVWKEIATAAIRWLDPKIGRTPC